MSLGRRWVGAIIGGAGAFVCAVSAYVSWFGGHAPVDLTIAQLVRTGEAGAPSSYWTSLAAPLAILGALGVLGALIRSRFVLGLTWLGGFTVLALWGIMRFIGAATDSAPADSDVGFGVWLCVAGVLAVLVGIIVMGPRREEIEAPLSVFGDDDSW
ncbi:hypothetical protein [Haloactinopolyspora sp.]|uniref:hypothetical protein n=1 Tax=Haloactinopolyspora sp. TaxID=1966353 RepID=UPI00262D2C2D|nr:hypothetical protein [Haloactinopolyspora sp.]